MLRLFSLFFVLSLFWLLLSGIFSALILILGIGSIILCVFIARRMAIVDKEGHPIHLTYLIGLSYFPWLLKEIVKSNIEVAQAILKPSLPISPRIIHVPAGQNEELGQVIFANSITLTPGTVSIAHEPGRITVHALLNSTAKGLERGEMNARVCLLEGDTLPSFNGREK
tara:strand:+ start:249 stop:755 length:507 start_codon:yes stop_codon:yes gene_type:complete